MAAKLLLSPLSLPSSFLSTREFQHHHRHLCLRTKPRNRFTVHAFTDVLFTAATTSAPLLVLDQFQENPSSLFSIAAADSGYSVASYYTSLGLFVISVPGLWSLIKRSVKSKVIHLFNSMCTFSFGFYFFLVGLSCIFMVNFWMQIVQKTFVKEGIEEGKKAANQVAGEILSFFTRNNFTVLDRGETIT